MNLFAKLPDNFFSILASRNKGVYGDALIVLYDALNLYRARIRKNDYVELLKSRSGDDLNSYVDEEDGVESESSIGAKANQIVKRLIETGWIYIDYDTKNGTEYILLPSYSVNMLKLIYEFADTTANHYVSYVHTTYADLKYEDDNQDESMYKTLENAYNNTESLAIEVAKLDHSIKVYKRQLSDMFEPNEVLKQHFDICREDVVDPIYHPLKTHDSITLYHGPISSILKRWLEVDTVREKLIDQCLKENKSVKSRLEATDDVVKKITRIQDIYLRLSTEINNIDVSQSEYVKASADKVIFLNNHDKSVKGKLEKIFTVLARNLSKNEQDKNSSYPNIIRAFGSSIKLYTQGYYDEGSLRKPYERNQKFFSDPLPLPDDDHIFDDSQMTMAMAETARYSDERVMEFMAENFQDKKQIHVHDFKVDNVDDFLYLMLGAIKATAPISFYDMDRQDELNVNIDVNDKVNAPDYIYTKKEN